MVYSRAKQISDPPLPQFPHLKHRAGGEALRFCPSQFPTHSWHVRPQERPSTVTQQETVSYQMRLAEEPAGWGPGAGIWNNTQPVSAFGPFAHLSIHPPKIFRKDLLCRRQHGGEWAALPFLPSFSTIPIFPPSFLLRSGQGSTELGVRTRLWPAG
jgi:hypothetical protein